MEKYKPYALAFLGGIIYSTAWPTSLCDGLIFTGIPGLALLLFPLLWESKFWKKIGSSLLCSSLYYDRLLLDSRHAGRVWEATLPSRSFIRSFIHLYLRPSALCRGNWNSFWPSKASSSGALEPLSASDFRPFDCGRADGDRILYAPTVHCHGGSAFCLNFRTFGLR